jgi:hypothetical protein
MSPRGYPHRRSPGITHRSRAQRLESAAVTEAIEQSLFRSTAIL